MKSNRPKMIYRRKLLRNRATPAECELWNYLKGKRICDLKFRRQPSIGQYILDFYCPQLKLAIELDGEYHVYNEEYDRLRDRNLSNMGIATLRYENLMVFEHPNVIIAEIKEFYENCYKSF
ncbi:endonuclease domain-containing protein [Carboxylicivirga sp. RSCT41]|uniref:endonuclease domain-containing protein n=1 Tax=Carboxylicivirga agarovorans TaxID=3417570 RepID=UPI003D33000D